MEPEREGTSQNPGNTPRRPVRRVVRQRPSASRTRVERDDVQEAPSASSEPVETPEETGPRLCPFCQQEVSAQAVVCRHCGRDLVAANGVRLVLAPESWNTNVPAWMLEQEQQYLKRRDYSRLIRAYWPRIVLGLVGVLVLAIVFRLLTAPLAAQRRTGTARIPRNEAPVSSLDMESADEKRKPQAIPTAEASAAIPMEATATPPAPKARAATDGSAEAGESVESVESLDVRELVRQFALDHALADDKFKDKLVRLTGNIKTIDTNATAAYIVLDTPSDIEVRCYLTASVVSRLGRLHPGSQVTLQGRCQGWFNNIVVSDCELR